MENAKKMLTLSFGEVLTDTFPTYMKLGGAPCNVAHNLNQLGNDSRLISAIGKDEIASFILDTLHKSNINTDLIQVNSNKSGSVLVSFNRDGEASYEITENVAWDYIEVNDELLELAKIADAFCFSSLAQRNKISRNTLFALLKQTSDSCLKIFDVNLRIPFYSKAILEESFHLADCVKMNETEFELIQEVFQVDDLKSLLLHDFSVKEIVLTYGKKGCALLTKSGDTFFETTAVDTSNGDSVGVGDAFISCFIDQSLRAIPFDKKMKNANTFAGYVATQKGAIVSFPQDFLANLNR